MIEDAYLYPHIRTGAEIRHSELLATLRNCADPDPAHAEDVHPALVGFWTGVLAAQFPTDAHTTSPNINEWDDWYQGAMTVAGRPPFLGRLADPDHNYTYKLSTEITAAERARFLAPLPFPDGTTGT
jgi:hypothetical protein